MNEMNTRIMEIQLKLELEEKMTLPQAGLLAYDMVNRFDERVQEGVQRWLDGQLDEAFTVEDMNLGEVCELTGVSPVMALNIMNLWFMDPDTAELMMWVKGVDKL